MEEMTKHTLASISKKLNVTKPWISKVIKELKLPRSGSGSRRHFTDNECQWIRNAKVMRMAGISWKEIHKFKETEALVRAELRKYYSPKLSYSQRESHKTIEFVFEKPIKVGRSTYNKSILGSLNGLIRELDKTRVKVKEAGRDIEVFLAAKLYNASKA